MILIGQNYGTIHMQVLNPPYFNIAEGRNVSETNKQKFSLTKTNVQWWNLVLISSSSCLLNIDNC